jgi:hypothetical protein
MNNASAFLFSYLNGGMPYNTTVTCASNALPSANRDSCVPCPRGMTVVNGVCACSSGKMVNDVCSPNTSGSTGTDFKSYAESVVQTSFKAG